MPDNLLNYAEVSSATLPRQPVERDLLILPLAAAENHGPHLPLGTDAIISEELARRVGQRLAAARPEQRVWLHPTWHLGGATIRGVGSVKVPSRILRQTLKAYLRTFLKQGFTRFLLLSVHGGVPHVGALDDACAWLRRQGTPERPIHAAAPGARIAGRVYFGGFADAVRAAGVKLTDEDVADFCWDLHAGRLETAMMLAIAPQLVAPDYTSLPVIRPPKRRWLTAIEGVFGRVISRFVDDPDRRADIGNTLRSGSEDLSWILRGRREGYVGQPHLATAAEGEALLDAVANSLSHVTLDAFEGRLDPLDLRSGAYLFRRLIAGTAAALAVALAVGLWALF